MSAKKKTNPATEEFEEAVTTEQEPKCKTHTVQKGDTVKSIALKYSCSVNKLRSLNGLYSDFLGIGWILKIPEV